ncbi:MAG: undecaprenyl-diphosphatase UppP [Candidatus Magasanikbacteria bacterium]|nr:undecaprenyl-diphosphatase UppP [Candidatus Magasanikbacteria bacterium]
MSIVQAIILGAVQGLTEFLPISSSGHLIFIPKIFGWSDQGLSFDIVVHLGTLLAVIVYFRKKIMNILKSFFKKDLSANKNRRLGIILFFSIVPAGIFGLLASGWIENSLRSSGVVAFGLIFWGLILIGADVYAKKSGKKLKDLKNISNKQAILISFVQAIALIPGTSRSGITMTGGLFSGLDKKTAAEFSFLMSIPIILLAGMLGIYDLLSLGVENIDFYTLIAGFITSLLSGLAAIWILMKVIQKWNFKPFGVYRILVGLLIIIFLA